MNVARIVAENYRDSNVLNKGHLVETGHQVLIVEYIRNTAVKTKKY